MRANANLLAAWAGALGCGALAVLLRWLHADIVLGPVRLGWPVFVAIAVVAVAASPLLSERHWIRTLGAIATSLVLAFGGLVGLALVLSGAVPAIQSREVPSPEPGRYRVVVRESRDWIDPRYELSVEGGTVLPLSWRVGCVNGDYLELADLRWRSATELEVVVEGAKTHAAIVSIEPGTGRVVGAVPRQLRSC